ncbi:MAG TPA: arginase [Trueperaceae bacterium]|nr:arginase [Trueperaceae bacterium]
MDVYLLGVPMDLGAGRRGVDMGPSALRLARLEPTLETLGHNVSDLGNVDVPVAEAVGLTGELPFADAIAGTCAAACLRLAALPSGSFPIALGGDHSISMGTVPGAAGEARVGVLWIDAHADLNTPATSPSGNVHGMPVAHLLGLGDERFTAIWGGGQRVRPSDLVYLGLRSVDPPEREVIERAGIAAYSMKEIDLRGIAAVAQEALARLAGVERLHVSFDADVLDPSLAAGVGTPVPGGLNYREAHLLMELLADSGRVSSLDLVEVNPILDRGNETAATVVELTASLLGKRIL